ncbi:MAG: hypothetical protein WD030_00920 [Pirellulales bacterium]
MISPISGSTNGEAIDVRQLRLQRSIERVQRQRSKSLMKDHAFGIAALLVGAVALGLAVMPGIALDRPLPFESEGPEEAKREIPELEGGVTFKTDKFSLTFGSAKEESPQEIEARELAQAAREAAERKRRDERDAALNQFSLAAAGCSLLGLVFGAFSWGRETQPAIAAVAMGMACLALLWQYVVIGVVVGVAIVVLLLLISSLGA